MKDDNLNINYLDNINIKFLEHILKELPSNIFFKDKDCKYVFATHYWRHLKVDDSNTWDIKGKTDLEIRKDTENAKKSLETDKRIIETGVGETYIIEINQDNIIEYLEIIKNPVYDSNGNIMGIVGLINDVTEKVLQEKKLEYMARQDQLTGLYNRSYLEYFYKNENKENIYPLSIIVADCNRLKLINDNYGHIVGDEYIKKSASIMRIALPDSSYVFRIGGDEFLALVPNTDKEKATKYVNKMNELCKSIKVKEETISVAYGINTVTSFKDDLSKDIAEADKSMYIVKEKMHSEM